MSESEGRCERWGPTDVRLPSTLAFVMNGGADQATLACQECRGPDSSINVSINQAVNNEFTHLSQMFTVDLVSNINPPVNTFHHSRESNIF